MEKIIYSREKDQINKPWDNENPRFINKEEYYGIWYDSNDASLDIIEHHKERSQYRPNHYWIEIELIEKDEIFIHQSQACYPNLYMLYLSVDELLHISKSREIGYKYKNITISDIIEHDNQIILCLKSDSKEEKILDNRYYAQISIGHLYLAIEKLKIYYDI